MTKIVGMNQAEMLARINVDIPPNPRDAFEGIPIAIKRPGNSEPMILSAVWSKDGEKWLFQRVIR